MTRLNLVAEGQSELGFVRQVLTPYLSRVQIHPSARAVLTKRDRRKHRSFKGGLSKYKKLKDDLQRWMREDQNSDALFSTIVDLYALPDDFPGYTEAQALNSPPEIVASLESSFADDIADRRFIPYIQLHEFEALLLCEPKEFMTFFFEEERGVNNLITLVNGFDSPELIDQGQDTAPSKRIIRELPAYKEQKSTVGPAVAQRIGVETMLHKCPHFKEWMEKLTSRANSAQ